MRVCVCVREREREVRERERERERESIPTASFFRPRRRVRRLVIVQEKKGKGRRKGMKKKRFSLEVQVLSVTFYCSESLCAETKVA